MPKRLSKKQRKKLAEQERLAEELRLKLEEEERLRKIAEAEEAERQRLAAIAEAKRVAAETKRLEEEEIELKPWRTGLREAYEKAIKDKKTSEEWQGYMDCSAMPRASKESDLTAYFTEYCDISQMKSLDATAFLKLCEYTELILENL